LYPNTALLQLRDLSAGTDGNAHCAPRSRSAQPARSGPDTSSLLIDSSRRRMLILCCHANSNRKHSRQFYTFVSAAGHFYCAPLSGGYGAGGTASRAILLIKRAISPISAPDNYSTQLPTANLACHHFPLKPPKGTLLSSSLIVKQQSPAFQWATY